MTTEVGIMTEYSHWRHSNSSYNCLYYNSKDS